MTIQKISVVLLSILSIERKVSSSLASRICPETWTLDRSFCWKYESKRVPWAEARANCIEMGAELASIHSESENRLLPSLINAEDRGKTVRREARKPIKQDLGQPKQNLSCFERHPNSVLVGFAEAVISSATVDECLAECLTAVGKYNVQCRSLMYYSESHDCILNSQTRFTRADLFATDNVSMVDYYDNKCSDQTRRMPGNNCFQLYQRMALFGFAERVFVGVSVQQCQDECVQASEVYGFECQSATYYPNEQTCILTRESRRTRPTLFGPEPIAEYYERLPVCNANPQPGCLNSAMDLFFIVDSSSSIGAESFENIRHFLKNLVGSFNIGPRSVMVGLEQFNEEPKTEFHLKSYQTTAEVIAAFDAMKWMGGRTLIGKALRYALDYELVVSQGNRVPDAPDVVILLTDGLSQDNPQLAAQLMRSSGVIVYAVGITEAVQDQQLVNIAGSPDRVYKISNFAQLDSRLRDQIIQDICRPWTKPSSPPPPVAKACSPSPYYTCPPDTVGYKKNSEPNQFSEQKPYESLLQFGAPTPPLSVNYGNAESVGPPTSSYNFQPSTVANIDQQQQQQHLFPSPPPFTVTVQHGKFKANEFPNKTFKAGSAEIDSEAALNQSSGVWLGLTDQFEESNFAWVDKTPLNYTKWKFGQPDGNKTENCVLSINEPLQRWIDTPCSSKNSYVCKKKANPI